MHDEFLMRRLQYTPNYVKLYCDIPILLLQEVYFESIIKLPKIIFSDSEFKEYKIFNDYISVNIAEWTAFQSKIVNLFNGENIDCVEANIKDTLFKIEKRVNEIFTNKRLSSEEFLELISLMSDADTFAIFNMYLPLDNYKKVLNQYNKKLSIEDIMVCFFEPHRIQVRKEKLKLVNKLREHKISKEDYNNYLNHYMPYEEFEKWIFDTDKFTNISYLQRELKRLVSKYNKDEIISELNLIDENRKLSLMRSINFINKCHDPSKFMLLAQIVTEEEKRHMIECKILLLIGLTLKMIDVDVSRTSIYDIALVLKKMEGCV